MQNTTVVNCRKEPYDIFIGRPSKWGNPYSHLKNSRARIITKTRKEAIDVGSTVASSSSASNMLWCIIKVCNALNILEEKDGKFKITI